MKFLYQESLIKNIYDYCLHFGGDYELLFTVSPNNFKIVKKKFNNIGTKITEIGKVIKDKKIYIVDKKSKKILPNHGYEHFKKHYFN